LFFDPQNQSGYIESIFTWFNFFPAKKKY